MASFLDILTPELSKVLRRHPELGRLQEVQLQLGRSPKALFFGRQRVEVLPVM